MNDAIRFNACDFVGIGRPTCLQFNLPEILLDKNIPEKDARVLHYDIRGIKIFNLLPIATIGSDVNTLWHNWRMHRVAIENQEPDPNLTVHGKIFMVIFKILKKSTSSIILFFTILFISFFLKQIFLKHNEKIITGEYNYTINKQKKTIVRLYNIICL
ncbi:unnamed protein product [Rotaria sp. Silwood2]|nr:unnamed protein product [Rotaria sp. Silwood2]CAF4468652.1 unnamed protein product [Rotaria sp. Silwood2]